MVGLCTSFQKEYSLSKINRLCFVCLGNIVRSPLAENMFRHLLEQAGIGEKYMVDSAGTSGWHVGEKPDRRMRRVASNHGVNYSGRAKQFQHRDFDNYDWIIAMDTSNATTLLGMAKTSEHQDKIHLMREFDPQGGPNSSVPDPYYGGIDGFDEVFQIVKSSCLGLLKSLENRELE
jgi:protein-tyrosine phosphatase